MQEVVRGISRSYRIRGFSPLATLCSSQAACRRCQRTFTTTSAIQAGHNKWSKTKHIKVVTDGKKGAERTAFAKTIAFYSRTHGEDPKFNPLLANAMTAAAKANVPRFVIQSAIARGQGRSPDGSSLESVSLEVLMPPDIALIVEAETDSKKRTLEVLKLAVKKCEAVASSVSFYFNRRGRIIFAPKPDGPTISTVIEGTMESEGLEDVEDSTDGGLIVWTEPSALMAVAQDFSTKFGLDISEVGLVWDAKPDTKVKLGDLEAAEGIETLLSRLRGYPEVQSISANICQGELDDAKWATIESLVDL